MRILAVMLVALLLGVALGVGSAQWRAGQAVWDAPRPEAWIVLPTDDDRTAGAARVSVDHDEHDFGIVEAGSENDYDFVLTNTGTAPLMLTTGASSCRCTVSKLKNEKVLPGQSANVNVQWKPREQHGAVRQNVLIYTNDPERPEIRLSIKGEVTVPLEAQPLELVFSRITMDQPADGEVRLLCNLPAPPLEILDFKLADATTADFFEVAHETIPTEQLNDGHTKSGVLLRIHVKPGLPQGPFRQTILLRTNLESTPAFRVPIQGSVAGDIMVSGADWDAELNLINIGVVSRSLGAERRLMLLARGPGAKDVQFTVAAGVPEPLSVKLGATKEIGSGGTTQTPLVLEIPRNARPVHHLGSEQGRIADVIIKTTHPKIPELRIRVRFAVEE